MERLVMEESSVEDLRFCPVEEDMFRPLFETIMEFIDQSGGDGDALIYCCCYKFSEVAAAFNEWAMKKLSSFSYARIQKSITNSDMVTFVQGPQSNIMFFNGQPKNLDTKFKDKLISPYPVAGWEDITILI